MNKQIEDQLLGVGNASYDFDEHVKYCELWELVEVWKPKRVLHIGTNRHAFDVVVMSVGAMGCCQSAISNGPSEKPIDMLIVDSKNEIPKEYAIEMLAGVSHGGLVVIDGENKSMERVLYLAGFLELNRFINCSFYRKP